MTHRYLRPLFRHLFFGRELQRVINKFDDGTSDMALDLAIVLRQAAHALDRAAVQRLWRRTDG